MTKVELVARIAQETGITQKAAAKVLDAFVGTIHNAYRSNKGKIRVSGLGTFMAVIRRPRNGVHPRSLEKIKIPAIVVPRFSPSKDYPKLADGGWALVPGTRDFYVFASEAKPSGPNQVADLKEGSPVQASAPAAPAADLPMK
jgi:DNA-binding protein HU-beta